MRKQRPDAGKGTPRLGSTQECSVQECASASINLHFTWGCFSTHDAHYRVKTVAEGEFFLGGRGGKDGRKSRVNHGPNDP